jgi:hypothetical protein
VTRSLLVATGLLSIAAAACGQSPVAHAETTAAELRAYVATVEPIRLSVNALVNGLTEDDVSNLPDTQSDQRAALIEWRVQLEVLGRRLGVALPADLQQAGRGEIAPSVSGGS